MTNWRSAWGWWLVASFAAVPASAILWYVTGEAWCGEETYDTPAGSAGDALCTTLVKPVVPWVLLGSLPFLLALVGGLVGIRRRNRGLYVFSLVAPFVLVAFAVFATLAAF